MVHLRQRLLIAMTVIVLGVATFMSTYVLWFSKPIFEESSYAAHASKLLAGAQGIESNLNNLTHTSRVISNFIQANFDLSTFYTQPQQAAIFMDKLDAFSKDLIIENSSLSSVSIYMVPKNLNDLHQITYTDRNADGVLERENHPHPALLEAAKAPYYYNAWMSPSPLWLASPYDDPKGTEAIELTCNNRVQIDGTTVAVIRLGVRFDEVLKILKDSEDADSPLMILVDTNNELITRSQAPTISNLPTLLESRFTEVVDPASKLTYGKRLFTLDTKEEAVMLFKQLSNNWRLLYLINPQKASAPYTTLFITLIVLTFLSMLCGLLFSRIVTKNIFNPITRLSTYVLQYKTPELRDPFNPSGRWISQEVHRLTQSVYLLEESLENSMAALMKYNDLLEREAYTKGLELKRKNEELQTSVKILEQQQFELQQLNEMLETNKSAVEKAQRQVMDSEKIASVGYLISGISHELNTPIGNTITLATFVDTELKRLLKMDPQKVTTLAETQTMLAQSLKLIENNLHQARDIIQKIKTLTVSPDQTFLMDINLKELLESLANQVFKQFPDRDVTLKIISDSHIQLHTDPEKMKQIFEQLYLNSILHGFEVKYSGQILIRFHQVADDLIIHYFDDGCGIDPDHIAHIFTPFFSTKFGIYKGLGLSLVHNLVTKYFSGSIQCDPNSRQGVHFEIRLRVQNTPRKGGLL